MTAAALVFSSSFPSPSLFLSLFHILNIANAKPAGKFKDKQQQQERQCLWCGLSSGKIMPNGFHPRCLEQFLALPEPCRTCALIWVDVFPGPPSTICLLWMRFPDDYCDAHKPWWEA